MNRFKPGDRVRYVNTTAAVGLAARGFKVGHVFTVTEARMYDFPISQRQRPVVRLAEDVASTLWLEEAFDLAESTVIVVTNISIKGVETPHSITWYNRIAPGPNGIDLVTHLRKLADDIEKSRYLTIPKES